LHTGQLGCYHLHLQTPFVGGQYTLVHSATFC